ncbi:asparagine synthase-related protein [Streptomyces sp. NPDC092296]|uniref:asparagine synthase-related protein n=1 Tax=Streptomyces sp. NPDC092296 TaxID=3366012 RepID=UPI00380AEFE5
MLAARAGRVHAALIGEHAVTSAQVEHALAECREEVGWESLTRFPGSYYVAVATPTGRYLIGDIAGIRPVFAAHVASHALLGSHVRILAEAAGNTALDPQSLALQLIGPATPTALLASAAPGTSLYGSVRSIPPGHAAQVDRNGVLHTARYWEAPDDDVPAEVGARALRGALRGAVAARDRHAVELSGGLDSTSLSFLAYERIGSSLVNLTREPADPGNDDLHWARLAVSAQPGVQHRVLSLRETPEQFDGISRPLALDAPGPTALSPDRSAHLWRQVLSAGARTLLSGKGGDELLCPPLSYLATAATRSRRTARRQLRGWAALHGWTRAATAAAAAHPGPYRVWLAGCLDHPGKPGWDAGPWLPPWLSSSTRRYLRGALEQAAVSAEPLHDRPHQHATLAAVRAMASLCRLQGDAAASAGVTMAYPYADRTVIDAALSVRAEDRYGPFDPKPLLTAAVAGIGAAASMSRRTKAGYSADTARAAARHHALLKNLLTHESALADHGLINPTLIRPTAAAWQRADPTTDLLLHLTLAAEVWVRTAENRPPTPAPDPPEASC